MNRLKFIWLAVAAVVATLVAASVLVAVVSPSDEPSWNRKKLTEWLEEQRGTSLFDYKRFFTEPRRAIEAIGTNGLPTLFKLLTATDGKLKKLLICTVNGQRLIGAHIKTADEKHAAAIAGFGCLGATALPALPQLVKLTRHADSNVCVYATLCCGAIETADPSAVLLTMAGFLKSTDADLKRSTGEYLVKYWPKQAEWYGVYEIFPDLNPVPLVFRQTNGPPGKPILNSSRSGN